MKLHILGYDDWLSESKINEGKGVYEYSCAMVYYDMPEMDEVHECIENDDLYTEENEDGSIGYGKEKEPHVTLLYGLHDDEVDPEDVMKECTEHEYPTFILKNASLFENDKYDVLKFDVESDILHKINGKLAKFPHTNDYPDYHPHSTIAYVKKGMGKKYAEMMKDREIEVTPAKIVYSRPDGSKVSRKVTLQKEDE